jgi:hypothetical protein
VQALGERRGCGRKLPAFIAQARLTAHEVLGLGVGEEDPAIPVKENGEPGLKKASIFFGNSGARLARRARRFQKTGG